MENPAVTLPVTRPLIVPVFLPHMGCPHQCVFCNQKALTGKHREKVSLERAAHDVDRILDAPIRDRSPVQIAFYGGNALGLTARTLRTLLGWASGYVERGKVDGIRLSTRPDTVNDDSLALLRDYPVTTVELGAQSMKDEVLERSGRGHTSRQTVEAMLRLKEKGYEVGLQMMLGLPGDSRAGAMESARCIRDLEPEFVRIYPTLVLSGSPLAALWQEGGYHPLGLEEAVDWTREIYLMFEQSGIRVARMGVQTNEALDRGDVVLAGPYHPAFGHLVHCALLCQKAADLLVRSGASGTRASLRVHPKDLCRLLGHRKANLGLLARRFGLSALTVSADGAVPRGKVAIGVEDRGKEFSLDNP